MGVADDATLDLLREYGVGYAQGPLFGEPRPAAGWLGPADEDRRA